MAKKKGWGEIAAALEAVIEEDEKKRKRKEEEIRKERKEERRKDAEEKRKGNVAERGRMQTEKSGEEERKKKKKKNADVKGLLESKLIGQQHAVEQVRARNGAGVFTRAVARGMRDEGRPVSTVGQMGLR